MGKAQNGPVCDIFKPKCFSIEPVRVKRKRQHTKNESGFCVPFAGRTTSTEEDSRSDLKRLFRKTRIKETFVFASYIWIEK